MMNLGNLVLCLLLITLAAAAVAVCAYSILILSVRYKYRHLPQAKQCNFFFGHLLTLRREIQKNGHIFDLMTEWAKENGPVFVVYFLYHAWVVTYDAKAIKEILITKNFPKPSSVYGATSNVLGTRFIGKGLVSELDYHKWTQKRHGFNPAFFKSALKNLLIDFNRAGDRFVDAIGELADSGKEVLILDWLHRTALGIICRVAYGKDLDVFGEKSPFNDAVNDFTTVFGETFRDPLMQIPFFAGKGRVDKFRNAINFVKSEGRRWTKEREEARRNEEYVPDDILNSTLDIKERGIYDETDDPMDDFITFFLAGHETTANTMSFALLEASRNPDVLRRMHEEVEEVLGQKPHISNEDIGKLPYLNNVWKEALRKFPVAGAIFRQVSSDDFKIDGRLIPKGATVVPSQYVSSRMPENCPDPEVFNPDRFSPDSPERPATYTYFPFSLGPRNCIGQNFAQLEGMVVLAKFLQNFNYKIDPNHSQRVDDFAALRPSDRLKAVVTWKKSF